MKGMKHLANKKINVELLCVNCEKMQVLEMDRTALYEADSRGLGRIGTDVYAFNGTIKHPHYINCDCGQTFIIKKVLTDKTGIEFCDKCGKFIDQRIANGDNLCEMCD